MDIAFFSFFSRSVTSSSSPSSGSLLSVLPLALAVGCGGKAVVDRSAQGTGGAGGAPASSTTGSSTITDTTSTVTTTSTGTGDCSALDAEYQASLDAARSCNACMNADHCIGGPQLPDLCGCNVGLVAFPTDPAQAAAEAYKTWIAAGCGPHPCGAPCLASTTWTCQPNGGGCNGICQAAGFGGG